MYFPIGWPKYLSVNSDSPLVHIASNPERILFTILTEHSISLWYCKPAVQIVCVRRADKSVYEFGVNQTARWKPDSSMLAITTSRGYILFYSIHLDSKLKNSTLLSKKEQRRYGNRVEVVDVGDKENVPALKLSPASYIQVAGGIKSVACVRDELLVSTGLGILQRIRWDGCVKADLNIELPSIPFSVDLQHSRGFCLASQLTDTNVYVSHLEYSPLLAGFAVVLSNGRAAFMTADMLKFEPSQVVGVWAQEITAATALAVNHRYMLMAFGCSNAEAVVYHLDEITGALVVSHKLVVSSKDFPDIAQVCGSVSTMKWTPDGCALLLSWQRGGFSLWSTFGALLLHSMGVESSSSLSEDLSRNPLLQIKSMEWGTEGYHLWVISSKPKEAQSSSDRGKHPRLLQLQFVKTAISLNPCVTNHEHLFLQGEDKLYLNPENQPSSQWSSAGVPPHDDDVSCSALISSKQWQVVPIPHTYLVHNWPIRFAAVNMAGNCVAVAGKTGLAHYTLFSRKWKLFGNETQEQDMVVSGGLTWWKDFICAACYNLLDQRDEIRFYPRDSKLDNTFAQTERVPSQIMLLNTFRDVLIVFCEDSHIMMFRLERKNSQTNPSVAIQKLQEVSIGNFISHPATVVAITLTSLRTETAFLKVAPCANEAESILLNVAGRLLMFQRDRCGVQPVKPRDNEKPLPFCAPVVVASAVENVWSCSHTDEKKPQLTGALWLNCGSSGMKVWLPLLPKDGTSRGFMSKRIMLPFHVDIYPIAMLFEAGLILGASSECVCYRSMRAVEEDWPYLQLERTSQVYLHHILRKLLRRNLGVHALEIAGSCTDLKYFHHVLELLVHEVLEEEATSKEPIPDPLLPRVIAFVQEFPEFLQTVVHCARKTEVALWQYLFSTTGNPRELFEECLSKGHLETAGSYLIILQSLEKAAVAKEHATQLLDAVLEDCQWDLARNLVRFLRSIDLTEAESPHVVMRKRLSTTSAVYPLPYTTPPSTPEDSAAFKYPTSMRSRSVSKEDVSKSKDKQQTSQMTKSRPAGGSREECSTSEKFFIDSLLNRHARRLLSTYRLRDLALFAANLDDYQLVSWLHKERVRAARVEDFVTALKRLHKDFHWPLPILTLNTLRLSQSAPGLCQKTLLDGDLSDSGSQPPPLQPTSPADRQDGNRDSSHTDGETSPSYKFSSPGIAQMKISPQMSTSSTAEVLLQPHEWSHTATEQSDTSSVLGDTENGDSCDSLSMLEFDRLAQELANRGPAQSQIELNYLLQIMLEAGCLEWALLIAIVLRDPMAVNRIVNTASLTSIPIEIVGRMREGLSFLELWADTECFSYKPFMQALEGQSKLLQSLVQENPPTSRMNLPAKRLSACSADSGTSGEMHPAIPEVSAEGHVADPTGDVGVTDDVDDDEIVADESEQEVFVDSPKAYDCVVS